jgi:oligopeptidase B
VYERENGLPKVTIYGLPDAGEPLKSLQGGHIVDFIDPIYLVEPSESQFTSSILRFAYSSMKTPDSVYDYDMKAGISVLKKIEVVSYINKSFSNYCVLHRLLFTCLGQ